MSRCSNGLLSFNIFSLTALFVRGNEVCCIQTVTLLILVASSLSSVSLSYSPPPSFIPRSSECEDANSQLVLTWGLVLLLSPLALLSLLHTISTFCIFLYSFFLTVTDCKHQVWGSACFILALEPMVASVSPFVLFFCCQLEGDDDDDECFAADIDSEYMITECIKRLDSLGTCK